MWFLMKKIEILSLNQQKTDDGCEVTFEITINSNPYRLQYSIYGENIDEVPYLVDPVVVTFFPLAMVKGYDICSEIPISEELYYNLTKHIIPQIATADKGKANMINISIPCKSVKFNGTWNGTGVSLGVDSFTTIHEYTEDAPSENYKLTHLVHLKTGAHHGNIGYFDKEVEENLFIKENEHVRKYCDKYNKKLITIKTNLQEVICSEFKYGFSNTHTVRNLGTILLLQNHFKHYYYASTYNLDKLYIDTTDDMSHYEHWLMAYISGSVKFYSANSNMNRIEKTKYISKFPDTYDFLHVCWRNETNCGTCNKCIRTLVQLDLLGVLDNYKNAFDLSYYEKNRKKLINRVAAFKSNDLFYAETYDYMKKQGMKVPNVFVRVWSKFSFYFGIAFRRILRKLKLTSK